MPLAAMVIILTSQQDIPGQISCTFDAWTSSAYDPYLAVTAHYISSPPAQPNSWELRSRVLGFMEIEGNHSGANTAAVILRVIDRYGIRHKVVGSVIKHKILLNTIFSSVGLQQIMPLPMTVRCVSCNGFLTAPPEGDGSHLNVAAGMTNILFFICWC